MKSDDIISLLATRTDAYSDFATEIEKLDAALLRYAVYKGGVLDPMESHISLTRYVET